MNPAKFIIAVHNLIEKERIILHSSVKIKYIYFYAYGLPDYVLAKFAISDILEDKIDPADEARTIMLKYDERMDTLEEEAKYGKGEERKQARDLLRRVREALRGHRGNILKTRRPPNSE